MYCRDDSHCASVAEDDQGTIINCVIAIESFKLLELIVFVHVFVRKMKQQRHFKIHLLCLFFIYLKRMVTEF